MLNNIDENIGISKRRYQIMFSLNNSFGVMRKKEDSNLCNSLGYECIYYANHDCVYPREVLIDILFRLRSGDCDVLMFGDIVSVNVNGILHSYQFLGVKSWDPENIEQTFVALGTDFFKEEKKEIISKLHKNGMVLDLLDGTAISIRDEGILKNYEFYGIEKEIYHIKSFNINMISEYSIYKLKNNKIVKANPGGTSFYDLKNALFYFLKKYHKEHFSVLLFDRKELEMVKDYYDLRAGIPYGT